MKTRPNLMVTLLPSMPHFERFVGDPRLSGIRLNGATLLADTLQQELDILAGIHSFARESPCYFDVKGRQLRVVEVLENPTFLDVRLNHPIRVATPTVVLFKAGADAGLLGSVTEDGYRLTFEANPQFNVRAGESLHIRDKSLEVGGNIFTDAEKERIAKVVASKQVSRWFVSYVEEQRDLDEFRELVPSATEVLLKIESQRGLRYVQTTFRKEPGLRLVAACGDLYVEVARPHHILRAAKDILAADPEALVGSRMMLSTMRGPGTYLSGQVAKVASQHPEASEAILKLLDDGNTPKVPDFADFAQLAWLYDAGYRSFMLCDELCLKGDYLGNAVAAFWAFRDDYCR